MGLGVGVAVGVIVGVGVGIIVVKFIPDIWEVSEKNAFTFLMGEVAIIDERDKAMIRIEKKLFWRFFSSIFLLTS